MATEDTVSAPVTEWRRVLEALDVAVVIHDCGLRIVYANRKAADLLGVSASEITARTSADERWDVIAPDGSRVTDDGHPAVRVLRTGQPVRGVTLGVRRGDAPERVWILTSGIPEFAPDGTVARIIVSFSDVSAAQRALREQEALYQTVFRSMSEGIAVHNPDGTIRAANAAAERVLGLTMDQMAGRAATDPRWRLVTADGAPLDAEDIPSERACRTGDSVPDHIIGVHRPSGDVAWLSVRADPLIQPGDDRVHGVVATFSDVTRQRETQMALEASRAHTQRVLDAVPGVVCQYLAPPEGRPRFQFVAGRIREVFGADPDLVRADPDVMASLLGEATVAAMHGRIAETVALGGIFEHDTPIVRSDGETRWLRIRGISESTEQGLLCTGVIVDVTEARHLADSLRRAQQREAMAHMAAGVAHNFNNMLAVIIPNLELARAHLPEDARPLVDDAERAATRAAELVRRMLALGRTDSVEPDGIVDLVPIVREVLHLCRQTFDRDIAIEEQLAITTAPVRGDASAFHQVLLNLCINARDALAGRQEPRLAVALEASGTSEVVLHVTDSGCGMAPEVLQHIGEPFFTTKAPGQGTGLGIASAFQTVAECGGSWMFDSTPGRGTAVTIRLPLADAAGVEPLRVAAPPFPETGD